MGHTEYGLLREQNLSDDPLGSFDESSDGWKGWEPANKNSLHSFVHQHPIFTTYILSVHALLFFLCGLTIFHMESLATTSQHDELDRLLPR